MPARTHRAMFLVALVFVTTSLLCSSLLPANAAPASDTIHILLPVVMKSWQPLPSQTMTPARATPTRTLTPMQPTPTRTLTPVQPTPTRTQTPVGPTPTATLTPLPPTPGITSGQLIDAALARGEIGVETALVCKVFASFDDPRLPVQFRGDDRLIPDSHIVDQVLGQYGTLSAATQAILNPFLMPPIYRGSWGNPETGSSASTSDEPLPDPPPCHEANWDQWNYINGIQADVRIWWKKSRPQDEAVAHTYRAALDGDIMPKLTSLMAHAPLDDAGVSCNAGSGALDIYLDERVDRSYQASHTGTSCAAHATYIVMNPAVSTSILAHEYMHTIQKSYSVTGGWCGKNNPFAWLSEATAQWAMDYVYPAVDEEQEVANWFFAPRDQVVALEKSDDHHEYGAYLFFFFATHYLNDNDLVRRAWVNSETFDSVACVDQAIPGGFAAVWDEFAVYNWNRPPYDQYQDWDQLVVQPALYGKDTTWIVDGPGLLDYGYLATVSPHLSLIYHHFRFQGAEPRLITFYNGLTFELGEKPLDPLPIPPLEDDTQQYDFTSLAPEEIKGVKIQAFFKIEGQDDWVLEDWTGEPYMSFCRDAKAERLQELVIIYSDSTFNPRDYEVRVKHYAPKLQISDLGCWRYGGSGSFEFTGQSIGYFEDRQQVPSVAFERTRAHPDIPYPAIDFQVVEGQWQRVYDIANAELGCVGHAEDSAALTSENTTGVLAILYGTSSGPSQKAYGGRNTVNREFGVLIACPEFTLPFPLQSLPWFGVDQLFLRRGTPYLAGAGGLLKDSGELPLGEGATYRFVWDLAPLQEP